MSNSIDQHTEADNHSIIAKFLQMESAGGILLIIAAIAAITMANSPLSGLYDKLLDTPVAIQIGALEVAKPLLLWINDGLMAIFFFLVGLELKRELIEGELSDRRNIILPGVGAIGGMFIPALVYVYFNWENPSALQGWAIPAATDIAFALGVLSLLGSRVPLALKVFLTSLAIFDDVGAILIIAFFYTANLSVTALVVVALCIPVLWFLNRSGYDSKSLYLFIGAIMWVSMLKSGVHATLAGVLLAMFIPLTSTKQPNYSPLKTLEHDLHSLVAFIVLPVFAFANAGLNFSGVTTESMMHGVPVGIALGLFIGKQVGIFGCCALAIKLGLAQMPKGMDWLSLYGTAALCGIGFTMSLFIGSLAFEETSINMIFDERMGILAGSILSGIVGYVVLRIALNRSTAIKE